MAGEFDTFAQVARDEAAGVAYKHVRAVLRVVPVAGAGLPGPGRAFYLEQAHVPEVGLRTTLITGFPQETEEDFEQMLGFVTEMRFEHLGVFAYSREEGSAAYSLKGQVPRHIRKRRRDRIMEVQAGISLDKNKGLLGREFRALVDEAAGKTGIARLYSQAQEIDGVIFLEGPNMRTGEFVQVRVTAAYDYDLKGGVIA